jgi:hypothetical protein
VYWGAAVESSYQRAKNPHIGSLNGDIRTRLIGGSNTIHDASELSFEQDFAPVE